MFNWIRKQKEEYLESNSSIVFIVLMMFFGVITIACFLTLLVMIMVNVWSPIFGYEYSLEDDIHLAILTTFLISAILTGLSSILYKEY